MVAACDLIQLESTVLEKLFQEFQLQQPEAMAFKNINAEPLCAIYSSQGLKKINTLYAEGKLTKHSMMHVLETLNTIYLPIKKEWQSFFKNFNQAEDLTQLIG
jgi:molybdopterin-guanine dinucleotide biosynthesis protein A